MTELMLDDGLKIERPATLRRYNSSVSGRGNVVRLHRSRMASKLTL